MEQPPHGVTCKIPKGIVRKHHSEDQKEERHTLKEQLIVYSRYYATHNAGQAKHTESRHHGLRLLKMPVPAKEKIGKKTYCDRYQCNNENIEEHSQGIHLHLFTCQPQ